MTALAVVMAFTISSNPAAAQTSVKQNSNVGGVTPPGNYRGMPAMQDNEASCAFNPLLVSNIVCAWNASGGSDDPTGPGDTWIRFSESLDGGRTFINRYLTGSNLNPATSVGQQFAADAVTLCWPGGCGVFMLASIRGESGGIGGGIFMQLLMDMNVESGFRHLSKSGLDQVYRSNGVHFADKPHAIYILDEENPGTVEVEMMVEKIVMVPGAEEGSAPIPTLVLEPVTRSWPNARLLVTFTLFNSSKKDFEIISMYSDNYGASWSNPRQVAVTSSKDQGVAVSAIGNTVFYGFRRFKTDLEPSALLGVVSPSRGQKFGKVFEIVAPLCAYDVPTLPNATIRTAAASRTNDFPVVSNDGTNFVMLFSERLLSGVGDGCLTDLNQPTDSRIMAVVGSGNGKNWGEPISIAPNPEHGFQFMPATECTVGHCRGIWWDTRLDSERNINFLAAQDPDNPAIAAFRNNPLFADFNFQAVPDGPVIQFRRTADIFSTAFNIIGGTAQKPGDIQQPIAPADRVSRYRRVLIDGEVEERGFNPFHIKAYRGSTTPFMSDYSHLTSVRHRLVFDPAIPENPPLWESNASLDPTNPARDKLYWASWTDARNVRGQIYSQEIDGTIPYEPPSMGPVGRKPGKLPTLEEEDAETMMAESVEDFNSPATFCSPTENPGAGAEFVPLNNRTKDIDIYGALIGNKVSVESINSSKTFGIIQRSFTIVAGNKSLEAKKFSLKIANQPAGDPAFVRASWDQLPFIPGPGGEFLSIPPNVIETIDVDPESSAALALFVVSNAAFNPVAVEVFEVDGAGVETLLDVIVVNGNVEAGPISDAGDTIGDNEIHNPIVFTPDEFNPDEFNPDEYNPDEFNPDLYTPDEFNPDEFNPDEFNPDEFNPDEFNPDEFNPDEFNPDEFNPDEFNTSLIDPGALDNPEIPDPDLGGIDGLVVKLDINYGVQNGGNTTTPYTVDFAINDPEVLALLENGQMSSQLIAWQDKKIDDVQFCTPREISENLVIASVNNPDLSTLVIPNINENRLGILTYVIAPKDIIQNTLRFIAPRATMESIAPRLTASKISYVFASQIANTGSDTLFVNEELIIHDATPATWNFSDDDTFTIEAAGAAGATIPADLVIPSKGTETDLLDFCAPVLGTTVGLDIDNDPAGATALHCEATTSNEVTATLDMFVSVLDRLPPDINGGLPLVDVTAEAGFPTAFTIPAAPDAFGVDDDVDVTCTINDGAMIVNPGDIFPFVAPGPTMTTVSCLAVDDSGNEDVETFTVTVEDTSPPELIGFPGGFEPPMTADPFVLDPDLMFFELHWGPFDVSDADTSIDVSCDHGDLVFDPANPPPPYTFAYNFPVHTTTVTCTASDSNNFEATASFSVTIEDDTPPLLTLNGDPIVTIDVGSGPYVDAGAMAMDNGDGDITASIVIDSSEVNTDLVGEYTVFISATDSSGNTTALTRTVIVEFKYLGVTGIQVSKTSVKIGSSVSMTWAWLGANGAVDSSGDLQILTINECANPGIVILNAVGDPGSSGFHFKSNNYWQYIWQTELFPELNKRTKYCVTVTSDLTGQSQSSPEITLR
jgi:hypothetical protein